jgi:F0F1-type ATP synthase assembly protein I
MGYVLDRVLGTSPYLLIVFFLYGVAAGFVNLFRVAKKYGKRK